MLLKLVARILSDYCEANGLFSEKCGFQPDRSTADMKNMGCIGCKKLGGRQDCPS